MSLGPRCLTSLAFLSLLCLAPAGARALEAKSPGPGWEEANRTKDFVIFTKNNEAAGAKELRVFAEVDAPPETVFKVVGDFEHYADFMPYVKECKILKQQSATDLVVYSFLSLPMVSNRDYAIRIKRTPGSAANGGVFRSEWVATPTEYPARDGVVRVTLNTGAWVMEPLDGGKRTRLVYELLTSPGGSIPQWIANKSNTQAIPDLVAAVKSRSANPNWKK